MKQRGIIQSEEGVAMVEMAIFSMIFGFLIIALIDFGSIASASIELSNALRTGEQFALSQPGNASGITQTIQGGSTLASSSVTATTSTFCECNGLTTACNGACGTTMAIFVSMTANYSVPLLFSYPGISNPYPLSKTIAVRVQ